MCREWGQWEAEGFGTTLFHCSSPQWARDKIQLREEQNSLMLVWEQTESQLQRGGEGREGEGRGE